MVLAIDVGNTRVKYAVFEQDIILDYEVSEMEFFFKKIEFFFQKHQGLVQIVLSSVGSLDEDQLHELQRKYAVLIINRDFQFPFVNSYATPETLGVDRLVLAAGATVAFPKQNRLVIDAGTCITYDVVTKDDVYLGGAISPGIRLRYESMHEKTAKLPLLDKKSPQGVIGDSTASSMHVGVVMGIVYEIQGHAQRLEEEMGEFTIILTGGDADFLAGKLKSGIFAQSNFLLKSLNSLYQFRKL